MSRQRRKAPAKKHGRKSAVSKQAPDKRLNERKEALEQQAATAEVLKAISRSTFDLQSVLNAMTRSAARLCAAYDAAILLREGDSLVFGSHYGPIPVDFTSWKVSRNWTAGRAVLDRTTVHVRDLRAEGGEFPEGHAASSRMGYRTILSMPLMRDNAAMGALTLRRTEVRPFSARQVALAETFAAQAVIAIENTRLVNELRESLERQTATSDVLQIISHSPGDLQPVFNAMLENAIRICEAQFGNLFLREGDSFRIVAMKNLPSRYEEWWRREPVVHLPAHPHAPLTRLAATKQLLHIVDLMQDRSYLERDPRIMALIETGARTMLVVPMLKENNLVGSIVIYRQEVRPFTDKQIELVQNFAAQAVIAIENTRLLHELRESLEQQMATGEILTSITASLTDTKPVFDAIVRNLRRLFDTPLAMVILLKEGMLHLAAAAHEHQFKKAAEQYPRPAGDDTGVGRAMKSGQVLQYAPVLDNPSAPPVTQHFARELGFNAVMFAPMMLGDKVIGAIATARRDPKMFDDKQIALIKSFAAQAVIAIENTRLLNELRVRTDELRQLNNQLEKRVSDQVSEIERVGRLRRFLPPQVADLIVSSGAEQQLESHRQEITALFCDLRGFTAFSESADPEDVMELLREYHAAIGGIIFKHGGTLERFVGDGVMVIFNDPIPLENPPSHAVQMALEMRASIGALAENWRRLGHEIGFGIGIAHGYATLGTIGFEGRFDYAAIGTVSNVASRLCAEAKPGQILISTRVLTAVKDTVTVEPAGELTLKGIRRPLEVYNVVGAKAGG